MDPTSAPIPGERPEPATSGLDWRRYAAALSFRRLSALYIFAALFLAYSLWVPDTFLTTGTWRSLLDNQALTAMAAVALTIPVAAGVFDLAIGTEVGLAAIVVSWLLVDHGVPVAAAIPLTILAGAAIGLLSAFLIAVVRVDSFIATLGVSSVGLAVTNWLSGSAQILNLPVGLTRFANDRLLGLTAPVYVLLALTLVVWYVLGKTPVGRHIYATGGNEPAARLAGVRTRLVIAGSLVTCGVIAAVAGLLLAARLGTGDPTSGPSFLLPAFSAVFLGSTQFHASRFNVWGTVVAVYVLAVGVKGLQLGGAPTWIPDLFNGLALILAVSLARFESARRLRGSLTRVLRRSRTTDTSA